jgi:hypothetical protein
MISVLASVPEQMIRADQAGDWTFRDNLITAYVARDRYPSDSEFAILIHELVEAYLCRKAGVTEQMVVEFDEMYEDERKNGHHKEDDEPGDDPRSPYRLQHMAATHVERAVCAALDLSWKAHCQSLLQKEGNH